MWGGVRRSVRPDQVHCVLAVNLAVVAFSLKFGVAERAGARSLAGKTNSGGLGERLNANKITGTNANFNSRSSRDFGRASATERGDEIIDLYLIGA